MDTSDTLSITSLTLSENFTLLCCCDWSVSWSGDLLTGSAAVVFCRRRDCAANIFLSFISDTVLFALSRSLRSSLHRSHHAPDQLHHEQLHPVVAAAGAAQRHHPGLRAALLREGRTSNILHVCTFSRIIGVFCRHQIIRRHPPHPHNPEKHGSFPGYLVSRVPRDDNLFSTTLSPPLPLFFGFCR